MRVLPRKLPPLLERGRMESEALDSWASAGSLELFFAPVYAHEAPFYSFLHPFSDWLVCISTLHFFSLSHLPL